MTLLPAKSPHRKDQLCPLGPPTNPATATDLGAETITDLEARIETGLGNAVQQAAIPWPVRAMIPLYVYPTYLGSFWNVIEANPCGVAYVIASPNSGPTNYNSGL